jgi:hypothetical protein
VGWYYDPNDPSKDDPDYGISVPIKRAGNKLKRGSTVKVSPRMGKKPSRKKKK